MILINGQVVKSI